MCKEVEKVLESTEEQAVDMPISCSVTMDGITHVSDDFVCVMARENGDASIFFNTDALTLGMAMKMVARAFVEAMEQLPDEEKTMVSEILGDSFILEKEKAEDATPGV